MDTYAKVNLYLKITGKRDDGYHELENLFWPLPWLYDTIDIDFAGDGISMEIHGADLEADSRNLCWRAAQAFMDKAQLRVSPHIVLTKRIPIAAGLGGGSSDAAAVLLLMNRLCNEPLPMSELHAIATKLGADVPFFLVHKPSLATGIGEKLTVLPAEPDAEPDIILANPSFPVPAAWAYQHWHEGYEDKSPSLEELKAAIASGHVEEFHKYVRNDLEYCIFQKFPILRMIRDKMKSLGIIGIHVSGSGPTLFGFAGKETPVNATDILHDAFPEFLRCFRKTLGENI